MTFRYPPVAWLALLGLTVLWGSAFLLTNIAVQDVSPALVVAARLLIAAPLLTVVMLLSGRRLNRSPLGWFYLALIALFGNALPNTLIAWSQQSIDSGLAGILIATMPLAALTLAHLYVPGERLTPYRVTGSAFGFVGVVVIMGPDAVVRLLSGAAEMRGIAAVLAAALSFAISMVLARRQPESDALTTAAGTTLLAACMVAPFALATEGLPLQHLSAASALAVGSLGVFCTALAVVLYFWLLKSTGPSFVSLMNYMIPVWAVLLGIGLLGEEPESRHLLALFFILAGVLVTQFEYRRPRAPIDMNTPTRSSV
ncbi:MAG: EamA family transporter [Thiohalocapsa sp.]